MRRLEAHEDELRKLDDRKADRVKVNTQIKFIESNYVVNTDFIKVR